MRPSASTAPCCSRSRTIPLHSSASRASTPPRGDKQAALTILRPLAARLPLPEFLAALGDLYTGLGDGRQAQEQYDLVHVIQQLNAGAGMNVDLELATFDVLHGANPQSALAAAQAAYRERPTIYAADTLAWAFTAPVTTEPPGVTARKRCASARAMPCCTPMLPPLRIAWETPPPRATPG